jgi:hypothetical protein
MKMDQGLRQMRLSVQLAEAMAGQAVLLSKREAMMNRGDGKWTHVLLERFPANPNCKSRKESWIMFTPDEVEKASEFHSYPYWKHALERGDTVLCSGNMMSWNILCETDIILRKVVSEKLYVSEWDMQSMVKTASKKFGL